MKRIDLENNKELLESDYEDMTLYAESFNVGAKAWVVNKNYIEDEVPEVEDMVIVHALRRRDNAEKYDQMADKDELMSAYDGYFDASGEFVTDDDIVYVFFENEEEYNTIIRNKAKREELEKNENLYVSYFQDADVYVESLEVGAKAWLVNNAFVCGEEANEIEDLVLVHLIRWSDNPDKYDDMKVSGSIWDAYAESDVECQFYTERDEIFAFFKKMSKNKNVKDENKNENNKSE